MIKTVVLIEYFSSKYTSLSPLGFVLVAAMLPLYYFNFKKKRKVFLGDGGSLFLGTLAAVYAFYVLEDDYTFKSSLALNKTLFSVLVLFYPLVDLLRVFVLRIKAGQSPFQPDQRHLHHILLRFVSKKHVYVYLIIIGIQILWWGGFHYFIF